MTINGRRSTLKYTAGGRRAQRRTTGKALFVFNTRAHSQARAKPGSLSAMATCWNMILIEVDRIHGFIYPFAGCISRHSPTARMFRLLRINAMARCLREWKLEWEWVCSALVDFYASVIGNRIWATLTGYICSVYGTISPASWPRASTTTECGHGSRRWRTSETWQSAMNENVRHTRTIRHRKGRPSAAGSRDNWSRAHLGTRNGKRAYFGRFIIQFQARNEF